MYTIDVNNLLGLFIYIFTYDKINKILLCNISFIITFSYNKYIYSIIIYVIYYYIYNLIVLL